MRGGGGGPRGHAPPGKKATSRGVRCVMYSGITFERVYDDLAKPLRRVD